jgi:hypothetical protein
LDRLGVLRLGRRLQRCATALYMAEIPDDGARIGFRPLSELDQGRPDLNHVALAAEQASDAAALRRRQLYDGLVGFHRYQRLVGDHVIALCDVPGNDLSLLETFAEIGEQELSHGGLR